VVSVDDSPGPERVDEDGTAADPLPPGAEDSDPDGNEGDTDGPDDPAGPGDTDGEPAAARDPLRFNSWMKRSATGAVMTGIAVGLQQALELPRQEPAFVIEASGEPEDPNRPIDLRFDPDSPANTVAIIRRPAPEPSAEEPSAEEPTDPS
jgi:hypothetical protein